MRNILFAISLLACAVLAQPVQAQSKADYYAAGTFEYAGITLPFRQLSLNASADGPAALVLILHGGTARGTDNAKQLEAAALDSVEQYLRANEMKAILLAPQCPADRMWNEAASSASPTMTDCLRAWLDEFAAANAVDSSRIYLFGFSMGGSGAWRLLNDNPTLFAGAGVAAATARMVRAQNVKATPVYAIAGANDTIMDAQQIEDFVQSLANLGGETRFDLLPDADHFQTCDYAFTTERLDWVFAHQRTALAGISDVRCERGKAVNIYNLQGLPVSAQTRGVQIRQDEHGNSWKVLVK